MLNKLSLVFLLVSLGFFIGAGFFVWERYYQPPSLAILGFTAPVDTPAEVLSPSAPARIKIPSLDLDLPVFPARVKGNFWPSTTEGVSYLVSSAPVGNGNTVLYGHNWPRLLGHLKNLAVGESILVTGTSGLTTDFIVSEVRVVSPSTVSILDSTVDAQLTLYTCTGFLDSQRLVVLAKPQQPLQ